MNYAPGVDIPVGRADFAGNPSLDVAFELWDITASPVLVSLIPMTHVSNGAYSGKFTPAANKLYQVNTAVYTDNTYTTVDTNYSPGESVYQIGDGTDDGSGGDVIESVRVDVSSLMSGSAVTVEALGTTPTIAVAVSDLTN